MFKTNKSHISLGILSFVLDPPNQISYNDRVATCVPLKLTCDSDLYWTYVVRCKEVFIVCYIEVWCVEAYVDCVIIPIDVLGSFYSMSTCSIIVVYLWSYLTILVCI